MTTLNEMLKPGALERMQNVIKNATKEELPAACATAIGLEILQVLKAENADALELLEDMDDRLELLEQRFQNLASRLADLEDRINE